MRATMDPEVRETLTALEDAVGDAVKHFLWEPLDQTMLDRVANKTKEYLQSWGIEATASPRTRDEQVADRLMGESPEDGVLKVNVSVSSVLSASLMVNRDDAGEIQVIAQVNPAVPEKEVKA